MIRYNFATCLDYCFIQYTKHNLENNWRIYQERNARIMIVSNKWCNCFWLSRGIVFSYPNASYCFFRLDKQISKCNYLSHKRTFGHMRPTKIQISLGIRMVWSESSPGAFWIANDA